MRTAAILFLATIMTISAAGDTAAHSHRHSGGERSTCCLDGISIDVDDGTVYLRQSCGKGRVEITKDCELYVNGRLVATDAAQKELLQDYRDGMRQLAEYAAALGREGARVGVDGARLGLEAVSGVLKVLMTSDDTEDFEADMEREAEKLEVRAGKLEDIADELEELADEVCETRRDLRRQIPELRRLGWF